MRARRVAIAAPTTAIRFTGLLSLSHVLSFAIGTYAAEVFMRHLGLPLVLAGLLAMVALALFVVIYVIVAYATR